MSVKYELWLTDEAGQRMGMLNDYSYISYTRAVHQFGSLEFAVPFKPFTRRYPVWFMPDWRVEVWRSPGSEYPLRREDVFLLRKPNVYTRTDDNMQMLRFYGRNGWDLLNRRVVIQRAGTSHATKTDYADDMMKAIVREQMLYDSAVDEDGTPDNTRAYPEGEFSVASDVSAGPQISLSFEGKNVLDVLKTIKKQTFQLYTDDPDNARIWYDVRPISLPGSKPLGWRFETRAGLFGADRTNELEFSLENANISAPTYSISHLDEVNTVYVYGGGRGSTQIIQKVQDAARAGVSRWNLCETTISASNETDTAGLDSRGAAELEDKKPAEDLPLEFLNNPGGIHTPRSLYGLDWDLGDLLRVSYAGMQFEAEVNLVYISVNENGAESIGGRNEVNNA